MLFVLRLGLLGCTVAWRHFSAAPPHPSQTRQMAGTNKRVAFEHAIGQFQAICKCAQWLKLEPECSVGCPAVLRNLSTRGMKSRRERYLKPRQRMFPLKP